MCLEKVRGGEYLRVRISLLHKPSSPGTGWLLFSSSPNTSWQGCGLFFFFKGADESFLILYTNPKRRRVIKSPLNKAGRDMQLNKLYFNICTSTSWLPCDVLSVPPAELGCLEGRSRACSPQLKLFLPWQEPALETPAPLCGCCGVRCQHPKGWRRVAQLEALPAFLCAQRDLLGPGRAQEATAASCIDSSSSTASAQGDVLVLGQLSPLGTRYPSHPLWDASRYARHPCSSSRWNSPLGVMSCLQDLCLDKSSPEQKVRRKLFALQPLLCSILGSCTACLSVKLALPLPALQGASSAGSSSITAIGIS